MGAIGMGIGFPFSRPNSDWYRSGGVDMSDIIAVYQPVGADALADSYVNVINPGTYDLTLGVAPTWTVSGGWGLNGTTQYLKTGVVPLDDQSYSMIVKYSDFSGTDCYLAQCKSETVGTQTFGLGINSDPEYEYYNGYVRTGPIGGVYQDGVLCVAGNNGFFYRTTFEIGIALPILLSMEAQSEDIYIGALNYNGVATFTSGGSFKIQAVAIYKIALTTTQAYLMMSSLSSLNV